MTRSRKWKGLIAGGSRTVLVSEDGGVVVGFASLARCTDGDLADRRVGEITALYVDPGHFRAGHGRALVAQARSAAAEARFDELSLWVLRSNRTAITFYVAEGFAPDGAEKTDTTPGFALHEARYRTRIDGGSKG